MIALGTGITLGAHATAETIQVLKDSDCVLYLVTEPATEEWLTV